jgi:curli production assembly/transport component CsgE
MTQLSASILVLVFFAFSFNIMAKVDNTNNQTKIAKKTKKIIALPSVVTEDEGPADELIISGIVLERTISRFGKEFTRQFTQSWQDVPNTSGVNVLIKENKLPRSGTRLIIELNGKLVYQTYFGMRQAQMKDTVKQATYYAIEGLARLSVDLSGPDLASSGY